MNDGGGGSATALRGVTPDAPGDAQPPAKLIGSKRMASLIGSARRIGNLLLFLRIGGRRRRTGSAVRSPRELMQINKTCVFVSHDGR
jgi:hypothetical protein